MELSESSQLALAIGGRFLPVQIAVAGVKSARPADGMPRVIRGAFRGLSFAARPQRAVADEMYSAEWIPGMKTIVALAVWFCSGVLIADEPPSTLQSLIEPLFSASCVQCHDADTSTRLNLHALTYDFEDPVTFRSWVSIYDRVLAGEMPPKSEARPDPELLATVVEGIKRTLETANLKMQRKRGRVPARRLTRLEYDYTVRDLFSIDGDFINLLPEESDAGSFDTVGTAQHFSAMHMESYLSAADRVFDAAVRLHRNPYRNYEFDLLNNEHLNSFHDREIRIGGNISRKLDDGVVVFRDVDYLLRSDLHGFRLRSTEAGVYRISVTAEAFQSEDPVALKVVVKDVSGQVDLVEAFDLIPGETHSLEVKTWLSRTRAFYVAMAEERPPALILADIYDAGGAKKYGGEGALVKSIHVEGPLTGGWPAQSTRSLLGGVKLSEDADGAYKVTGPESPLAEVRNVISRLAPRVFRRPPVEGELEAIIDLAKPAIAEGQDFVDVIRIPLRAILSSPQFLLLTGKAGELDDYELASRLSYFLWKSLPDDELFELAGKGELSDTKVLRQQVDRMLQDDRSQRFIRDFSGQWLRLNEIEATTPDEKLYPEYDEILHWSICQETEAFFTELITQDLSLDNLIDSDFAFLNRRLASHYDVEGVTGQSLRRVELPDDSPRGGVLTQASVLKVTANGLVTSPVKRGAYVLTDLLGTPPAPPPPDAGTIEPDISGATTIRETLKRHRDVESCAKCHNQIDPPGFALECFDPIGGFRKNYRKRFDDIFAFVNYEDGPVVDVSGETEDGRRFQGIQEFKDLLMEQKEPLARHFISQLVVYSTGGEIQFADRDEIDAIFERTQEADFAVRTIIHEVVQNVLFRNR